MGKKVGVGWGQMVITGASRNPTNGGGNNKPTRYTGVEGNGKVVLGELVGVVACGQAAGTR